MPKSKQIAALPWRITENGLEILLVTTRTTKRWVIPKGWTMDGKADHDAAVIEAFEEAGVRGRVETHPVGSYGYLKILQSGRARHVTVQVFSIAVDEVLDIWPERAERQRRWVSPEQAQVLIGEPELLPVISAFARGHAMTLTALSPKVRLAVRLKKWWHDLFA